MALGGIASRLRYFLVSLLLVTPCFWLPRIEAGDLSSHAYNAWLAQLIARGEAPGLSIEPQWTNVLFDLLLGMLWGLGPVAAQRIAVAAAVLVFYWGALQFVRTAARRDPWWVAPLVGVLAYGWVFHAGFFNFYISLGLCFWALAWMWRRRFAPAVAVLALASTAHALAVLWTIGVTVYLAIWRGLRPRYRGLLAVGAAASLAVARILLAHRFQTVWYPQQIAAATGADQLWVYGSGFQLLAAAAIGIGGWLFALFLRRRGWRRLVLSPPAQMAFVTAAVVVLLPSRIQVPGYGHALGFVAERMSLATAVSVCAVLASMRARRAEAAVAAVLAAAFFTLLYTQQRAVNRTEERLERAVALLPRHARVISALSDPEARVDPLVHLIDRACIGRCFSYGNYEPATRQFRVRAAAGNPIVVTRYADSYAMQTGTYEAKTPDLPLWGITGAPGSGELTVRPLVAAQACAPARMVQRFQITRPAYQ